MKFFRPTDLPNPYPAGPGLRPGSWECVVTDFKSTDTLYLGRESEALPMPGNREAQYFTAHDYTVNFRYNEVPRTLTVPAGCLTDLASIPRFARWYIGRVGPHLECCIVHDFLFVAWQLIDGRKATRADWRFANAVLYAGLRAAKVSGFKRWLFRLALDSEASWDRYRERDGGPKDEWLFVEVEFP